MSCAAVFIRVFGPHPPTCLLEREDPGGRPAAFHRASTVPTHLHAQWLERTTGRLEAMPLLPHSIHISPLRTQEAPVELYVESGSSEWLVCSEAVQRSTPDLFLSLVELMPCLAIWYLQGEARLHSHMGDRY